MKNRYLDDFSKINWPDKIIASFNFLKDFGKEIYLGIKSKIFPVGECLFLSSVLSICTVLEIDRKFLNLVHLGILIPKSHPSLWFSLTLVMSPVIVWGLKRVWLSRKFRKKLHEIFETYGVKTSLGRMPELIFDEPIDSDMRKLRFNRAIFPLRDFKKVEDALAAGLHIHIDEIKEDREQGTIDVVYSKIPMPSFIPLENIETVPKLSFLVGKTRAREIIPNLLDVPHLLVGGQSGGGKSAFLRQIITTLYLRNEDLKFSLVDLKGGLEFQLFERLKRIKVIGGTDDAASFLESIDGTLEYRMKLLKKHSCVDMEAYVHLLNEKKAKGVFLEEDSEDLTREIIVVDEAAEMFLASSKSSATAVQTARKVLSQVARQGRAVGVHLIVATQRPDAKALDPQIKANLPGVICYRMTNDPSSISVLGNGRATDLPPVKGRAIWKNGSELVEIQTPFLSPEDADAILEPFRITVEGKKYSKRKSKTQKDENGDTPPNSESDDV